MDSPPESGFLSPTTASSSLDIKRAQNVLSKRLLLTQKCIGGGGEDGTNLILIRNVWRQFHCIPDIDSSRKILLGIKIKLVPSSPPPPMHF